MSPRSSRSSRPASPSGAIRSVAARRSATLHQRCPVIIERSRSSCPSVFSSCRGPAGRRTSARRGTASPPPRASHRLIDVATTGPSSASVHAEPGLLEELAHRGAPDRLAPVHAAARREPPALPVGLPRAEQQDPPLRVGHQNPRGRPPYGGLVTNQTLLDHGAAAPAAWPGPFAAPPPAKLPRVRDLRPTGGPDARQLTGEPAASDREEGRASPGDRRRCQPRAARARSSGPASRAWSAAPTSASPPSPTPSSAPRSRSPATGRRRPGG